MDKERTYCNYDDVEGRLLTLNDLGGIRSGFMRDVDMEAVSGGYVLLVRRDSRLILFDLDVLIRINSLN